MKTSDLRVFDNGGKTLDRYTILPPRSAYRKYMDRDGSWNCIGCSETGLGFFMWVGATYGTHLGQRISFDSLPPTVQSQLKREFEIK